MHIEDLARVPNHLPIIAGWIHAAFWQESGQPIDYIQDRLQQHQLDQPLPCTFVALENSRPVGSVCLIDSDMVERPTLTPWLAALYVLPAYRRRGIGSQLVDHVVNQAGQAGFHKIFLNADDRIDMYARLGWTAVETNVGPLKLTIMAKRIL